MDAQQTFPLTRGQIGDFIKSPRGIRAFEAAQEDISTVYGGLSGASFLTISAEPSLGNERILTPVAGELTGSDGGSNNPYTLGLADTAVVAGSYGASGGTGAASFVTVTVDKKGRLTAAGVFAVSTTNIPEGTNLYYTNARARAAISAVSPLSYNSTTGAMSLPYPGGTTQFLRADGTWATPTATVTINALTAATYLDGTELLLVEQGGTNKQATVTQALGGAYAMTQTAYSLSSTTAAQKIFNGSTNGAVTLATGTYAFEMMLYVSGMSATSGNATIDIKGAGTAVFGGSRTILQVVGIDAASPGTGAAIQGSMLSGTGLGTAAAPVAATTGTIMAISVRGYVDIATSGTLIPSIALTTAVATAQVMPGSVIRIERIGPTATATMGNWS